MFCVSLALPVRAEGAFFYLSPASGNYETGKDFSTHIFINAEGVAINAAQAEIYFPSEKLKVLSVSKVGSIFSLWVQEPVFSNTRGVISFGGGLPSPGYRGSAGKVITVSFRAVSSGEAKVFFGKEIITANDPWGTNAFSFSREGIYSIFPPEKLPPEVPTPEVPIIDTEPPHSFEITVDNEGDSTNPQPLLYFETEDELSGMSYYEVRVKEEIFRLEKGETMPYRLPKLEPGAYDISVKAFDRAGNFNESGVEVKIESISIPQITICPPVLNPLEELFYAEGIVLPNSKVIVFFEKEEKLIKEWDVNSDGEGNWFLVKEVLVKSGIYKISVKTEDERGTISYPSEPCFVKVILGAIAIGPWIMSYKTLIWVFVVILILILALIFYLIWRSRRTRKLIEKETQDLKQKFYKEYNEFRAAIERELEALRKAKTKRELSEEEKEREKNLLKELSDVKEVFTRELKDIEEIK